MGHSARTVLHTYCSCSIRMKLIVALLLCSMLWLAQTKIYAFTVFLDLYSNDEARPLFTYHFCVRHCQSAKTDLHEVCWYEMIFYSFCPSV